MSEKKRPGVMFYFETRPCLRRLSLEEKGLLLEAALDYAQYGHLPELDGMAGMAWDFIQPRVDRDGERYERVRQARSMAARKRWDSAEPEQTGEETHPDALQAMQEDANAPEEMQTEERHPQELQMPEMQAQSGEEPPEQEESWWEDLLRDANAYDAEQTMPNSNPNPNTNSNTNSNPDTNSIPNLIHPISAAGRAGNAEMDWEDLRRRKIGMLSVRIPSARSGTKPPPEEDDGFGWGEKTV